MEKKLDVSYDLAKYVVNTKYEDIPADVVEKMKIDFLDHLGVGIAAIGEPGSKAFVDLAKGWGGKDECTVIGYGFKAPAPLAAAANATLAHALDYDDVMFEVGHVGVGVIPAAYAAVEMTPGTTAKDFITACVLGIDVMTRLGSASITLARGYGWLYTPLYGTFGSAVAAGKILGLTEEEMVNAFGIAYSMAAGTRQPTTEGALVKRMQAGLCARAGLVAAMLAKNGVTGPKNTFEGTFGLFHTYQRDVFYKDELLKDFGTYFAYRNIVFKKFPACSAAECSVEASLEILKEHPEIKAEDIDHITAHVSHFSRNLIEPIDVKQNPTEEAAAQFSVPWVVATAFNNRTFTVADTTEEQLEVQGIRDLARKVDAVVDIEVPGNVAAFPARIEVFMKDSNVYDKLISVATGAPSVPMSLDEMIQKFRENCECSAKTFDTAVVDKLVDDIMNLEKLDDLTPIMNAII